MDRVLIITSGAFLEPELEAEFGRIPPAFLPIGNRRLFAMQCRSAGAGAARIVMSVPEEFEIEDGDLELLSQLRVEIIKVPAGLSLGESLLYTINLTAASTGPISILHGDTLLEGFDFDRSDCVSVDAAPANYRWGRVFTRDGFLTGATTDIGDAQLPTVLSGYFAFSDGRLFVREITRARGDFLDGIVAYSESLPLATVRAQTWLDMGHVRTYYQARRKITTQREFNSLTPTKLAVIKSGRVGHKIEAEARWFIELPPHLRAYVPAFLGAAEQAGRPSYTIEYIPFPTLSELFVFGHLDVDTWIGIFGCCGDFLNACLASELNDQVSDSSSLYEQKTMERLEEFARASTISLDAEWTLNGKHVPSLRRIVEITSGMIDRRPVSSLVHGDFCLSNILYDARSERLKVIDPRGLDGQGQFSNCGDLRYDLAKMYHSVVGRYDHIVANYVRSSRSNGTQLTLELPNDRRKQAIEREFLTLPFAGMTMAQADAPAISVLLFLSMLPLHSDAPDRQMAFLANAMRLFLQLETTELQVLT